MPEMKPSRDGYGLGLVDLGQADERVVVLGADLTASTRANWFQEKFPGRFFSTGIAEANMVNIAAGLSLAGKVPFVCTYGVFVSGRAWDQVRTTVCYANLNVKLGGAHGGISVGPDGATHQALEDIALMRCLPNMTVVVPCDALETRKATVAIGAMHGPAYVRFGREPIPVITEEQTPFTLGRAETFRPGDDLSIIACGYMVSEALKAAETLQQEDQVSARVINLHTVKPIDRAAIARAAAETGAIVTAEEHQVMGGFGSAVAEVAAAECPVPMRLVGIQDRFGESGEPEELLEAFGCCAGAIVAAAREVLKQKK
ncbi:MAG TPA: transketolase C-terminal domain-containing protein [Armatimonadota bacterium]|nr:transketolase C-terminal domain-containing protein [Armatimonadota bacterium]